MYLTKTDLTRGIRAEVIETLTRGNDEVILQAIAEAEQEVASYLSARYDIDAELRKTPDERREAMVVKMVREIALFNIYNFAAPVVMPDNKQKAYDNTIALLKLVQAERANIDGLCRRTTHEQGTTVSNYIDYGGNTKRQNHF